nr:probable pectinesterase/pectinesterase inhibitor 58 [Ipomoea batatas]
MARDIGFENSAGPEKHQAVALRVGADRSIFYNCQMDGYQDTLYTHTYRQFYRDCIISGTIDFIFGNGAVVLQNCTFMVRKPMENQQCIVTAQGRIDPRQPTGLVLQNCSFEADPEYYPVRSKLKSYLGRPWKEYSRTIIMESFMDDLIQKDGWLPWNGDYALDTLFYTEYNNRGPSSSKGERVKWKGVKELPLNRIERFTAARFIQGDVWIKRTRLPYNSGFIYPPPEHNPEVKYSPVMPDEIKDMGAKEKATYDPPKASPPPSPPSPGQFSFSSIFGGGGLGGSPPTKEPADSSNHTSPKTSTPVHPSPESTSGSSSASVQTPASSPGPVQAPYQFSTIPISVTPVSAPVQGEAPTQASESTFGLGSPGPVQASPQSSTAPVSSPVQASASTPSPVPTAAPPGNSATEVPVAAPSGNLDTHVKVAASSENLIATPSIQTKTTLGPNVEVGVKTPSPSRNQPPKNVVIVSKESPHGFNRLHGRIARAERHGDIDKRLHQVRAEHAEIPSNNGAPIMSHQEHFIDPKGLNERYEVSHDVEAGVGRGVGRGVRLAVAAEIRRHGAVAQGGQELQLVAPQTLACKEALSWLKDREVLSWLKNCGVPSVELLADFSNLHCYLSSWPLL